MQLPTLHSPESGSALFVWPGHISANFQRDTISLTHAFGCIVISSFNTIHIIFSTWLFFYFKSVLFYWKILIVYNHEIHTIIVCIQCGMIVIKTINIFITLNIYLLFLLTATFYTFTNIPTPSFPSLIITIFYSLIP
jgi:hypothetical protein